MMPEGFRIKLAKRIDEFVGAPLVFFARLFDRPTSKAGGPLRRVLFVKFWGIGSIVLAEPALRRLKERHPGVQIHFLTLERNRGLFPMIPVVDRLHCLPFRSLWGFGLATFKLLRRLRAERYDAVFDAEFFVNYSGLLAWALKPRRIVGFSRADGAKRMLQHVSVPFREGLHTASQFLNLACERVSFEAVDGQSALNRRRWPQRGSAIHEVCGLTAAAPVLSIPARSLSPLPIPALWKAPYVVVNVNASPLALERRWSGTGFAVLGKALLENFEIDLVLIGTARERSYVESIAQKIGGGARVRNLAGTLDLVQLAQLLQGAVMLVSNDSGPIHMASAFNVPTVGLYGPETPLRYGPLSSRRLVFYEDLRCSPCMSVENAKTVRCVNSLACMKSIDAERAARQTARFLRGLLAERTAPASAGGGVR